MKRVCVVGSGSWGTAFSTLLAATCETVVVWSREDVIAESIRSEHRNCLHLRDALLPENIVATTSQEEAVSGSEAVVLTTPSAFLRTTSASLAPYIDTQVPILVLSKGMEAHSHKLMHEVVADELGHPERIAVLSGPNHAEEVIEKSFSAAVVASEDLTCAKRFQKAISCREFRTYVSDDVRGVEACAAAKNVVAIACGVAVGSGAGDNTLAALMTRGIAELGRIVVALGGNPLTCMGLAGMGDLVVTCTSRHSRNRSFGEALVGGETLDTYQSRTHMVVEGAQAVKGLYELGRQKHIEMPLTDAVYAILYEGASIDAVVANLMDRMPCNEFYGIE
ncbi:NAD(P)H-dependent glycerol-3-phosphate dehydrogenase [Lancefieldella rimae]|uniref:NAD(P)H-dependent glycerol-3-phosphate dehydrogenase n=1 Tax=Lancefieldella rimae TaxID=1383 RepID=UPI0028E5974F|nr:NAD(P)H-dependent glycerol-3-phosphate dehydrogenase [Lancefieldella rimae]